MHKNLRFWLKRSLSLALLICLTATETSMVSAAELTANANPRVEINTETVTEFVNTYFSENMEAFHVPGVAVAAVKDGSEIFKAGYGVADINTKESVNPETTTFPACSVSKLFTASSIMKLYEEGKLDLDENVESYLGGIKIQNAFNAPVTCRNLLTHSSGLDEESELDIGTGKSSTINSQEYYFSIHQPQVIYEPNTLCRYSNMGYNILGYVIENVSGQSYEEYVQENILNDLEMTKSSVRIDDENMASGYAFADGTYENPTFGYQYTSGSSGIIAPVTDMENFMIMHLDDGQFHGTSIINSVTAKAMQTKQFSNNAVFDGMGFGFIRSDRNGANLIKHEGGLPGYATTLFLIPEQNFGIYVATNALSGMAFDFEDAFLAYFYGDTASASNLSDDVANVPVDDYTGTYRNYDGISKTSIMKMSILFDATMDLTVTSTSDGALAINQYNQSKEVEQALLYANAPDVFTRDDGLGYFTFTRDDTGDVSYAFNDISYQTFEKTGAFENRQFLLITTIGSLLILIISALFMVVKFIRKKILVNPTLYLWLSINNILLVAGSLGSTIIAMPMIMLYDNYNVGILKLFLTLILIAMISVLMNLIRLIYKVIRGHFSKKEICLSAILIIVQIGYLLILNYFNMIGYNIF